MVIKNLHVWGFSLFLLLVSTWVWSAPNQIMFTHDLPHDASLAQSKGVPLLVIFTSSDCVYCERSMQDYLIPMQQNPQYAHKILIRRIQITDETRLTGWDGKPTTGKAYAASLNIKLTPTIIVFTPDGKQASDPIVGVDSEDYYGGYLDNAIDAGLAKMHPAIHSPSQAN